MNASVIILDLKHLYHTTLRNTPANRSDEQWSTQDPTERYLSQLPETQPYGRDLSHPKYFGLSREFITHFSEGDVESYALLQYKVKRPIHLLDLRPYDILFISAPDMLKQARYLNKDIKIDGYIKYDEQITEIYLPNPNEVVQPEERVIEPTDVLHYKDIFQIDHSIVQNAIVDISNPIPIIEPYNINHMLH